MIFLLKQKVDTIDDFSFSFHVHQVQLWPTFQKLAIGMVAFRVSQEIIEHLVQQKFDILLYLKQRLLFKEYRIPHFLI